MSYATMRSMSSGEGGPLGAVVQRAMEEHGEFSIRAMRASGFRAMAPLMDRAQIILDQAVVEVGMERLTFVADLVAAGLTYNLTDPLGTTMVEYNKAAARTGAAQRTMNPEARGENKLPSMAATQLPIYLTTDYFSLGIRTLKMSQRVGQPIDTALIKDCVRSVNEAFEDAALNGATTIDGQALAVHGYAVPGLLNAPDANTHTITVNWATATGAEIFADVMAMMAKARTDFYRGPFNLYAGTDANAGLDRDYSTLYPGVTIRKRLLEIEGLSAIRYADMMPALKVVLVQMTSNVVDLVMGQPPTVIPYTSNDGMVLHNLIMGIQVPRVRSDTGGGSGIVIGTMT